MTSTPARAGRRHAGPSGQLVGRPDRQQPAQVQVADPPAPLGLVHVMRRDEQRHVLLGELEEQVPQVAPRHRIDPGRRLIEEDQPGLVQQGTGQGQPLLPPAGERVRRASPGAAQAHPIDQLLLAMPRTGRRQPVDARVEVEVLLRRQVLVEGELLRHVPDPRAHGLRIAHRVMAQHPGRSRCQRDQPAEGADQRGLARPVGPEQAEDLAVAHGQAHAVDRGQPAEPDGDLADIDDRPGRLAGRPAHPDLPVPGGPGFPSIGIVTSAAMPDLNTPRGSSTRTLAENT